MFDGQEVIVLFYIPFSFLEGLICGLFFLLLFFLITSGYIIIIIEIGNR